MPECVLRASGRNFEVAKFLSRSKSKRCAVWRNGEVRAGGSGSKRKRHTDSRFNLVVSDADESAGSKQSRDPLRFLERHHVTLRRLRDFLGVQSIILNFGVWQRSERAV